MDWRRMPFGKYKGEPLGEIPSGYLNWALQNCRNLDPWLRVAIRRELERRLDEDDAPARGYPPPANLEGKVRSWYREMVLKYHPDRGGNHEAMKAINDAHERLKQRVGMN
jgi:hypothetical protein